MFYTRPNLAPLGLDMAEIEGGGSCPSQFEGLTTDGRPVYIRYRGGHFAVYCGEVGGDPGHVTQLLLEADFGPPLHGDLLLEQACDLAGITVRGERLVLTDEKFAAAAQTSRILDWSGRTTYWVRDLSVSEQGRGASSRRSRTAFQSIFSWDCGWSNRLTAVGDAGAGLTRTHWHQVPI